ncbi:hypothetical protein TcWFU_002017 [Taenia crassiceps]|uniref:Uncharacterized protein n=1 Tax=Taenia crassiceps TaxID=6207 RepID=A0ABR4QG11_9CEST
MELLNMNEPVTCGSREAYFTEGRAGFTKDKDALMTAELLLTNCFAAADDRKKRECLFLIALANTKMGDHQSSDLKAEVERRRRRAGTLGLGAIGLAVGGVALGVIGAAAAYGIQKSRGK